MRLLFLLSYSNGVRMWTETNGQCMGPSVLVDEFAKRFVIGFD